MQGSRKLQWRRPTASCFKIARGEPHALRLAIDSTECGTWPLSNFPAAVTGRYERTRISFKETANKEREKVLTKTYLEQTEKASQAYSPLSIERN
jgi:hypothetical protein